MAYENPASAVGACRRQGRKTAHAIYQCAIDRRPRAAGPAWTKVAQQLAVKHAQLGGAKRRRRKRRR